MKGCYKQLAMATGWAGLSGHSYLTVLMAVAVSWQLEEPSRRAWRVSVVSSSGNNY